MIFLILPQAVRSLFRVNRTGIIVFILRSLPPGAVLLTTMPQIFVTKVHKKEDKGEGVCCNFI